MTTIHPEYVVDENRQPRAVLLPLAEWEHIIEELEELDDIRAYDKAKSEEEESIPFEDAVKEIEGGRIS